MRFDYNDEPPLKCLIGIRTPLTDSLLGVVENPENKTYDELRFEGMMEKYGLLRIGSPVERF